MNQELKWEGPFKFNALSDVPREAGVYLWLIENGENPLVYYIGSAANICQRQAEHLEMLLGGGYYLINLDNKDKLDWVPPLSSGEKNDSIQLDARIFRLTKHMNCPAFHELALKTARNISIYCAKTNGETRNHKQVERKLIEIARQHKGEPNTPFVWFYQDLRGTREYPEAFSLEHGGEGKERFQKLFSLLE